MDIATIDGEAVREMFLWVEEHWNDPRRDHVSFFPAELVYFTRSDTPCLRIPTPYVSADMCDTPDEWMVDRDHMHIKTCTVERRHLEPHTLHRCALHNVYVIWED